MEVNVSISLKNDEICVGKFTEWGQTLLKNNG